jgi:hypothetical protein
VDEQADLIEIVTTQVAGPPNRMNLQPMPPGKIHHQFGITTYLEAGCPK